MKNKKSIIEKIAKRKRVSPTNITNLYADSFNYFFSYTNKNGKFIRRDIYSFNEIREKPVF